MSLFLIANLLKIGVIQIFMLFCLAQFFLFFGSVCSLYCKTTFDFFGIDVQRDFPA